MSSGTRGRSRTYSELPRLFLRQVRLPVSPLGHLARPKGLEPSTSPMAIGALFQLSYDRVVEPAGIEPALPDRGSGVLPLDDGSMVGQPGVEPGCPV